MAYCPNCEAAIIADAPSCERCGANFEAAGGWQPKNTPENSGDRRAYCLRITYAVLAVGFSIGIFFLFLPMIFWLGPFFLLFLVLFFGGAVFIALIVKNYKKSSLRTPGMRIHRND